VNARNFLAVILAGLATGLNAQTPAPAKPPVKNYIVNGGFERVAAFQNLYDGVDSSGAIRVQMADSPVFLDGGNLTSIPFACSPNFADVNKDGLPDLIVASPDGHLYWFPNIGKKGEPQFDHAKLVETYLGPAPRIHVCDWNGDGRRDILFGNTGGEAKLLFNLPGGGNDPRWTQSMGKPRWFHPRDDPRPQSEDFEVEGVRAERIPISVGVYSAPCFADWNKDGVPDLIMGEGTYSANSVYVWINSGTLSNPSFKKEDDSKFTIAFGEGREQLTPSVYDWNGDNILDLIVGDRDGRLALYLGAAEAIKDSKDIQPIEFTKFISIGGRERFGGLISPHVCDYNEDGAPDILYGTASGAVHVALGKGDRKDPELAVAIPLKGVDFSKNFKQPAAWICGTFSGLPTVISKQEDPDAVIPEGEKAFRITFFEKFYYWYHFAWNHPTWEWPKIPGAPMGYHEGGYRMVADMSPFIMGKDYEISFRSKGKDMRLFYNIRYDEYLAEIPKGEPTRHFGAYGDEVSMGPDWRQTRKTYRLMGTRWKRHDTNDQTNSIGKLIFLFQGEGEGWLDDVKINAVEKK